MAKRIEYTAKDCSEIICFGNSNIGVNDEFLSEIICNASETIKCFRFSDYKREIDNDSPIVEYNFRESKWFAGRYIGEISLTKGRKEYYLSIVPRFGEHVLLEMLGEIFHLKLTGGFSRIGDEKSSLYVKLLISYLWSCKLSAAVRYGLPRTKKASINTGYTVKGKLSPIPSAFSMRKNGTVISETETYCYDRTIVKILSEAHRILVDNYHLSKINQSATFKETIKRINCINQSYKHYKINEKDYQSIVYPPIYQQFKDVVDFSWNIIQSNNGTNHENTGISVSGFLLDMAEIWECYLRMLLYDRLKSRQWSLVEPNYSLYNGLFYHRAIIPDIILKKGNTYCVFDAKYKHMSFSNKDIDRGDFFQIHTYISYLQSRGNVVLSGLLYPIETSDKNIETLSKLFGNGNDTSNCWYIVDGPRMLLADSGGTIIEKELFFDKIDSILERVTL